MRTEIESLVSQAYKHDLEIEKKDNNFFITLDDEKIDITELVREHAPQIMNLDEDKIDDYEFYVDLSLEAEFETEESSDNYGEIPGEPHVPFERRTYVEILSTDIYSCEIELHMCSALLFKVDFLKTLNQESNRSFLRTLSNIVENLQD